MYIGGQRYLFRDIPMADRRSKGITFPNNKYELRLRIGMFQSIKLRTRIAYSLHSEKKVSGSFHPKKIRIRKSKQRESFPITANGGYPFPTAKHILFILIDEATKGVINPFPIPYNG